MELSTLKNLGTEMQRKLNGVGINNAEELRVIGSKTAFTKLKIVYPEVCLVHLYSLQGAIDGVEFSILSKSTKKELKEFVDGLK